MNQTRIKNAPKLTQEMIDHGFGVVKESRWTRLRRYLGATSGPILTIAVIIAFALFLWAMSAILQMPPINTAIKG